MKLIKCICNVAIFIIVIGPIVACSGDVPPINTVDNNCLKDTSLNDGERCEDQILEIHRKLTAEELDLRVNEYFEIEQHEFVRQGLLANTIRPRFEAAIRIATQLVNDNNAAISCDPLLDSSCFLSTFSPMVEHFFQRQVQSEEILVLYELFQNVDQDKGREAATVSVISAILTAPEFAFEFKTKQQ